MGGRQHLPIRYSALSTSLSIQHSQVAPTDISTLQTATVATTTVPNNHSTRWHSCLSLLHDPWDERLSARKLDKDPDSAGRESLRLAWFSLVIYLPTQLWRVPWNTSLRYPIS